MRDDVWSRLLSLSLSLPRKKKRHHHSPLFPFSLVVVFSDQTKSRESLLEKKKKTTTRKEGGVFLCWSSRNLSIMVFKREKKREGLQRRSVLIGEEIQLGFRVFFFGLGFFFVNVFVFLFSLLLLLSFTNQLQNPTISQVWNTFADLYTVRHEVRTESISLAAQRNFDTLLGFIGCVYNFI